MKTDIVIIMERYGEFEYLSISEAYKELYRLVEVDEDIPIYNDEKESWKLLENLLRDGEITSEQFENKYRMYSYDKSFRVLWGKN